MHVLNRMRDRLTSSGTLEAPSTAPFFFSFLTAFDFAISGLVFAGFAVDSTGWRAGVAAVATDALLASTGADMFEQCRVKRGGKICEWIGRICRASGFNRTQARIRVTKLRVTKLPASKNPIQRLEKQGKMHYIQKDGLYKR